MYPGLAQHRARIDRLPAGLKAALAAACAQRQAEVYHAYVKRTGAGSSEAFDNLLNAIWDDICRPRASEQDRKNWEVGAEKLLKQKTKSDIYGGGAEFAILSLLYSNDILTDGKTQDTIYSSNQTFNAIYNLLTSPIGKSPEFDITQPGTSAKVLAHPLSIVGKSETCLKSSRPHFGRIQYPPLSTRSEGDPRSRQRTSFRSSTGHTLD